MQQDKTDIPAWFSKIVFRAESLAPKKPKPSRLLPPLLRQARKLEKNTFTESTRDTFLKQGRLLADYEDDFEFSGDPIRYYPTYQSLTDTELRGYFAWRSRIRKGIFADGPATFVFLYIYELLNNIGVPDPQTGYEKLLEIRRHYGGRDYMLDDHMDHWLRDYVIYYNLDKELLADSSDLVNEQCLSVLDNIAAEPQDRVIDAIKQLAPKWLQRSKFYASHIDDMDTVIYRVLQKMAIHYAKGCKRSLVGQFFGMDAEEHIYLFGSAVFCDPLKRRDYRYALSPQHQYVCEDGLWFTTRRVITRRGVRKLDKIIKTIDSLMRQEYNYPSPIRSEVSLKWLTALIRQETQGLLAEKTASKRRLFKVDAGMLAKVRHDAGITRDRLIVGVETDAPLTAPVPATPEPAPPAIPQAGLTEPEQRLLRCLLYGGDLDWLKSGNHILSVLVDAINEKLYDTFEDAVLDDGPEVLADYVAELKEMIPA